MVIAPLAHLEQDLERVEAELQKVIEERSGSLRSSAQLMFETGGKRLRPAMVLLTSKLFGGVDEGAIRIATAVEMIHGASLLHDDVIDGTSVRRGAPTLNSLKGNHYSVLLGDFLLCQSLLAVADLGRVELLQVISQAVADMTEGQILEAQLQGDVEATEEAYLKVVDGKTAALMAASCQLAALNANASLEEVEAARDFGRYIGLAFQIIDDILDIWGDPALLGKPVGSDLQEQKYTLPFLLSYRKSGAEERQEVRGLLGNGNYPGEHMPDLVAWMDRHRARTIASDKALEFTTLAQGALSKLPPGQARDDLSQLLDFLMERQK